MVRTLPSRHVVLDHHGRQVVAPGFRQYVACEGCGYLIGCGDAVDSATHEDCLEALEPLQGGSSSDPAENASLGQT